RVLGDGTGRGNVVGGNGITEQGQAARAANRLHIFDVGSHAVEIGRVLHVGAAAVPLVDFAFRHVQALPAFVAGVDVAVALLEHVRIQRIGDDLVDFRLRRPDVLEVDVVASAVLTQRVGAQVHVDGTGQRIGHDQRRTGEEVHAHVAVHAPFEVAVAGEHGGHIQVRALHGVADRFRQRAGVADAG